MSLPFRRARRPASGANDTSTASMSSPEQRQWEVAALLSSLHPLVRDALSAWLVAPTDPRRWPPPDTFSERRWPIDAKEAEDQSRPVASRLLHAELKAIRQTLDMPPDALSGLTRNGLLAVHGIRLRQLEHWLWPFYAAREITRMIR